MDKMVIAFDLDDTLAVSKSPLEDDMVSLLARLLARYDVCIISGGNFHQFQVQVVDRLDVANPLLDRLHLMPTCGAAYYTHAGNGTWLQRYSEELDEAEKRRIIATLTAGAQELGLWELRTFGPVIEDRGSQITFSALGQQAPPQLKHAWDPDGVKRRALQAYCIPRLPGLAVRSGGSTSVDVTRQGIDKAFGMRRLMELLGLTEDDLLFVGDRLDEGGNDYPVKAMGIDTVAVRNWRDTAEVIGTMLDRIAA